MDPSETHGCYFSPQQLALLTNAEEALGDTRLVSAQAMSSPGVTWLQLWPYACKEASRTFQSGGGK